MKDKTTAALLAFFLGGIGVHKFYLGKSVQGIMYLIFSWTLIPSIIAFIEFIIYLSMDLDKFNQTYNNIPQSVNNTIESSNINVAEEIEKLHRLKESGALTEEEFTNRKAKLL